MSLARTLETRLLYSSRMVELSVTSSMITRAEERAEEMGALNNSITEGEANLEAFIAEQSVSEHLKQSLEDTYDYDLLWAPKGNVLTADIKTKRRTKLPSPYFDCHIADTSLHQDCDTYIFTSIVKTDNSFGVWALGWITKKDFLSKAKRVRKGDRDGRFVEHVDAYKCKVSELWRMP